MPPARKTQTISDSVAAVMAPVTAKMAQSSRSFFNESFISFQALRTMMAMTAAPTP